MGLHTNKPTQHVATTRHPPVADLGEGPGPPDRSGSATAHTRFITHLGIKGNIEEMILISLRGCQLSEITKKLKTSRSWFK